MAKKWNQLPGEQKELQGKWDRIQPRERQGLLSKFLQEWEKLPQEQQELLDQLLQKWILLPQGERKLGQLQDGLQKEQQELLNQLLQGWTLLPPEQQKYEYELLK